MENISPVPQEDASGNEVNVMNAFFKTKFFPTLAEELLHPIVSGFSATLVLIAMAKLFRQPKFADFYNFLVSHIVHLDTDIAPLSLLLAGVSFTVTGSTWRNIADRWVVVPSLRLITHLYAVASGTMMATIIITVLSSLSVNIVDNMLLPFFVYLTSAWLSAMVLTQLFAFSEARIGNSRLLKYAANFIGILLIIGFIIFMSKT